VGDKKENEQPPQGTPNPWIYIVHKRLDFSTLQKGSSKTLQETLTNPNNTTLIWNVSITYGTGWTGWLSLNLSSGTIPANGNQDLSVMANTSALTPGTYNATLTFSGNFSPNEQVAVNLVVQ